MQPCREVDANSPIGLSFADEAVHGPGSKLGLSRGHQEWGQAPAPNFQMSELVSYSVGNAVCFGWGSQLSQLHSLPFIRSLTLQTQEGFQ